MALTAWLQRRSLVASTAGPLLLQQPKSLISSPFEIADLQVSSGALDGIRRNVQIGLPGVWPDWLTDVQAIEDRELVHLLGESVLLWLIFELLQLLRR